MPRIFIILAILFASLRGAGFVDASMGSNGSMPCTQSACMDAHVQITTPIRMGCCEDQEEAAQLQDSSDQFCPMSNGPCRCGINPTDQPAPRQPWQGPSNERSPWLNTQPFGSSLVSVYPQCRPEISGGLLESTAWASTTHTQRQAFLGIWQT